MVNARNWLTKGVYHTGYIWNASNCKCECDKWCDVGEYLDYGNCKCRKRLADKLVEECAENIDEVKIASENEQKNKCCSYILYTVLFSVLFTVNIGIAIYFVYYKYMNVMKKIFQDMIMFIKQKNININERSQTNRDKKSNLLFLRQDD